MAILSKNEHYFTEKLSNSFAIDQKVIEELRPIILDSNIISQELAKSISKNSFYPGTDLLNESVIKSFKNQNIKFDFPPSESPIKQTFASLDNNIANLISDSVLKWDSSSIMHTYKSNILDLSKYDFRINVLSQEVEKDLSVITHEEFTYPNDKVADFYEKIQSDLFIQKKQTNEQTDELNELKLMIVSMSEKIGNLESEPRNDELNKYQSNEPTRKDLKKSVKNLVFAFFFVCEFIEHSETAYQLFIWLKSILSGLIHIINISN